MARATIYPAHGRGRGRDDEDVVLIKDGFSWPAFFFSLIWALWHRLWSRYIGATSDHEVLEVAPPWLAWRALVIANPRWYPALSEAGRDRLLGWVERSLEIGRLDPRSAEEVPP